MKTLLLCLLVSAVVVLATGAFALWLFVQFLRGAEDSHYDGDACAREGRP